MIDMKNFATFLPVAVLAVLTSGCSSESEKQAAAEGADLILTNGRVYSMRWDDPAPDGTLDSDAPNDGGWQPDADAVAIKNGEIVFVGATRDVARFEGEATRIVDLAGATVLPGLVDSHTHVFGLGAGAGGSRRCSDRGGSRRTRRGTRGEHAGG